MNIIVYFKYGREINTTNKLWSNKIFQILMSTFSKLLYVGLVLSYTKMHCSSAALSKEPRYVNFWRLGLAFLPTKLLCKQTLG
jgi:hypothetical protein